MQNAPLFFYGSCFAAGLIQKEAKVNDKDNNGNSLLHLASEKGHINIANLLIDKGANINDKDKNGYSPLHWAAQNGRLNVVDLLKIELI
ncbi:ankyrin repeat domain-containing protein [Candidatus Amoebophilus asiaticus]|uniref:ankyrin repeat domain-containing protein n=1 Tax=Candidatus Amoebophilus asiaticus TaxID=281120 RepID=UPI000318049F|nr:ankyrin repeat domain-containing protein [Candidatus Amoebophilus asiaticus]